MKRTVTTASTVLVISGLILLANVWCETQRQAETQQILERQLVETSSTTQLPVTTAPQTTVPQPTTTITPPTTPPPTLNLGQPLGTIRIPSIDVNQIVVYGIGEQELKGGPGQYPQTVQPSQTGLTAIAGHRTTHGAPFRHLDKLEPGDEISLDTPDGFFTYQVQETLIVLPTDMSVLDGTDGQLVLTACNPVGSARERIVIKATQTKETT